MYDNQMGMRSIVQGLSSHYHDATNTLAEFKSFVMNNKAFGNLFCNSQKKYTTQQWHLHLQNILDVKYFVNAIVEFEE